MSTFELLGTHIRVGMEVSFFYRGNELILNSYFWLHKYISTYVLFRAALMSETLGRMIDFC